MANLSIFKRKSLLEKGDLVSISFLKATLGDEVKGYMPFVSVSGKRLKGNYSLDGHEGALSEVQLIIEAYANPTKKLFSVSKSFKDRLYAIVNKSGFKSRPLVICIEVLSDDIAKDAVRYEIILVFKVNKEIEIYRAILTPDEFDVQSQNDFFNTVIKKLEDPAHDQ